MAEVKSKASATRSIAPVRMRKLPQVQQARFADTRQAQAFEQMRDILATRFGEGGAHTEKAVTWGDLVNSGFAALRDANGQLGVIDVPTGPVQPLPEPIPPDDSPPAAPTGLEAVAGLSMVILSWDDPPRRDYSTEIHRAETQNLSDAVNVGQTIGTVYADYADGGRGYWYWVRHVSAGGRVGAFSEPAFAEMVPNPDWMLEQLAGQVTESALTKALQDRINLVDGPETLAGSVSARVRAEATARGAAITTERQARQAGDEAVAGEVTSLAATLGQIDSRLTSAVQTEQEARIAGDEAVSRSVTTLSSTVSKNHTDQTAALRVEAQTRADVDGGLLAQYTVKTDVNGRVTGFGFATTAKDAIPLSEFTVIADRFAVVSPSRPGETPKVPFVIGTVDGVTGTVMANAFIADGAVTRLKVGLAAIDDARIASMSAAKIRAGSIAVGEYIQSTSYRAGQAGWRINGNGDADFANVTVRGTVFATAGEVGGVVIQNNGLQSTNWNGRDLGWRIAADGSVVFKSGSFRGTLEAATGTFSGELSAATGTFSGSLSAASGTFSGQVRGGSIAVGSYTSYEWPAGNGTGAFLGPVGLRLGNVSTGKFFQVDAQGNMAAPGFSVNNGVLTISQANVINTLQLAGEAVTVPRGYYGAAMAGDGTAANRELARATLNVAGQPFFVLFTGVYGESGMANGSIRLWINGQARDFYSLISQEGQRGTFVIMRHFDAGMTNVTVEIVQDGGYSGLTKRALLVLGLKR